MCVCVMCVMCVVRCFCVLVLLALRCGARAVADIREDNCISILILAHDVKEENLTKVREAAFTSTRAFV